MRQLIGAAGLPRRMTKCQFRMFFFSLVEGVAQLNPAAAAAAAGISSLLQSRRDRDYTETQNVFRERLGELQERIDENQISQHTEEISEIAHNCWVVSLRTAHAEKKRAAANILWNTCLKEGDPDKQPLSELDHFARSLESLSLDALQVLREAVAINKVRPIDVTSPLIAQKLGISVHLCVALLRQLDGCDFVILDFGGNRAFGNDPHTVRVRPLAEKFVTYVMDGGTVEQGGNP